MNQKWSAKKYPALLKNYPTIFRKKVLEIANQLFITCAEDENEILAQSISSAKEWAENNGIYYVVNNTPLEDSNEIFTIAYTEDNNWVVKDGNGITIIKQFYQKSEAIRIGRELAKDKRALLHILSVTGDVLLKVSYHSRAKKKVVV